MCSEYKNYSHLLGLITQRARLYFNKCDNSFLMVQNVEVYVILNTLVFKSPTIWIGLDVMFLYPQHKVLFQFLKARCRMGYQVFSELYWIYVLALSFTIWKFMFHTLCNQLYSLLPLWASWEGTHWMLILVRHVLQHVESDWLPSGHLIVKEGHLINAYLSACMNFCVWTRSFQF